MFKKEFKDAVVKESSEQEERVKVVVAKGHVETKQVKGSAPKLGVRIED